MKKINKPWMVAFFILLGLNIAGIAGLINLASLYQQEFPVVFQTCIGTGSAMTGAFDLSCTQDLCSSSGGIWNSAGEICTCQEGQWVIGVGCYDAFGIFK